MPTRNVYVSDKDQALFREAAEIAGGLSPAVSEALHEYVQRRRLVAASLKQIEVDLRSEGVDRRVSFMGRRLARVQRDHKQGHRVDTVYVTAKSQIAVVSKVQRSLPGWAEGRESLVSSGDLGQELLDGWGPHPRRLRRLGRAAHRRYRPC